MSTSVSYFLEDFDLTGDDGEDAALNLPDLANDGHPGLIGLVEYGDVDYPTIRNGRIILPRSAQGDMPLADFEWWQTAPTAGALKGFSFYEATAVSVKGGHMYFTLAQASGTAIEGGSSVGSSVSSTGSSENTPGAIAGILYDASITCPIIDKGIIKLPMPKSGDSALQGLVDDKGYFHTWEQVEGYVGSQVPVAGLQLRLAENFYATFMLNVGIQNNYLSFNFSYE